MGQNKNDVSRRKCVEKNKKCLGFICIIQLSVKALFDANVIRNIITNIFKNSNINIFYLLAIYSFGVKIKCITNTSKKTNI